MFGNKRQLCYQGANKVLHRQWALSSNHWRYCQGADKVKKCWLSEKKVILSNACGGLQAGCCALEVVEFQRRLSAATTFRTCLVSGAGGGRGAVAVGEGGGVGAPSGAPWQAPGRTNFISIVPVFIWWEVYLRVTVQFVSWGLLFSLLLEGYCSFCYLRVTVQFVHFVTWG